MKLILSFRLQFISVRVLLRPILVGNLHKVETLLVLGLIADALVLLLIRDVVMHVGILQIAKFSFTTFCSSRLLHGYRWCLSRIINFASTR
eukprot:9662337-Heterocapsa_arctica.AAC.1